VISVGAAGTVDGKVAPRTYWLKAVEVLELKARSPEYDAVIK